MDTKKLIIEVDKEKIDKLKEIYDTQDENFIVNESLFFLLWGKSRKRRKKYLCR
tara:strand:- start:6689 stop:6850 length:162 start_codon:yes stop_codon:yes gene_type:complete